MLPDPSFFAKLARDELCEHKSNCYSTAISEFSIMYGVPLIPRLLVTSRFKIKFSARKSRQDAAQKTLIWHLFSSRRTLTGAGSLARQMQSISAAVMLQTIVIIISFFGRKVMLEIQRAISPVATSTLLHAFRIFSVSGNMVFKH